MDVHPGTNLNSWEHVEDPLPRTSALWSSTKFGVGHGPSLFVGPPDRGMRRTEE
jgi:hypothetical protein